MRIDTRRIQILTRQTIILMGAFLSIVVLTLATTASLSAGEADVVNVTIHKMGRDKFTINATLSHADTGWDHYANRWEVLDSDGNILGTRVLHHPHVDDCLLYTSPSPRDLSTSRMPSSA